VRGGSTSQCRVWWRVVVSRLYSDPQRDPRLSRHVRELFEEYGVLEEERVPTAQRERVERVTMHLPNASIEWRLSQSEYLSMRYVSMPH
jgi:hypothetical protein